MSEGYNPPPQWMLSFADLLSLILTFFVLIFSISKPPTTKTDYNNVNEAAFSLKHTNEVNDIRLANTDQDLSLNYLYDVIKEKVEPHPELKKMRIRNKFDSLVLSTELNSFSAETAKPLADILKALSNKIELHTPSLNTSYTIYQQLQQNGVGKNLSFYESPKTNGKIDIVIYP